MNRDQGLAASVNANGRPVAAYPFEVDFYLSPKGIEGRHDEWSLIQDTRVVDKNTSLMS
jgi:hypothetical protein